MSSLLRTARRLPRRERGHAARALVCLVAAEAALRLFPFRTVQRWQARVRPSRSDAAALTPAECAQAIRRGARVFPTARCLARAVAGQYLLQRAGHRCTLTIGVGFQDGGRFHAHTWLECEGTLVTGGEEAFRYRPLARNPTAS